MGPRPGLDNCGGGGGGGGRGGSGSGSSSSSSSSSSTVAVVVVNIHLWLLDFQVQIVLHVHSFVILYQSETCPVIQSQGQKTLDGSVDGDSNTLDGMEQACRTQRIQQIHRKS